MAKIYNCPILSSSDEHVKLLEYPESVQIRNGLGEDIAKKLETDFREDDIDLVNYTGGECGAGGDTGVIFPIVSQIYIGLAVYVTVSIGKGFFDEFGRGLAKKLLSVLFDKNENTEIQILSKARDITVMIPSHTNKEHQKYLEDFLANYEWSEENIKRLPNGKYIYSKDSKTFIKISN